MHGPTAIAAGLAAGKEQLRAWRELTGPIPSPTAPLATSTRLCIGMATFDDFDGVWFTIASILLHHPEVADDLSFVIIDNHPTGPVSQALKGLEAMWPRLRYVPFRAFQGTSVRDLVFREAQADIVCCVDSHVLIRPGGLAALLRYFDARPECRDLVQGPLLDDRLTAVAATHLHPTWSSGMFGSWGNNGLADDFSEEPYELASQGLGLFACRKDAWPGFHSLFRRFGAEEGYLHEKMRRAGGRTVGLPALAWGHRFVRPRGVPYEHTWESFLRNYELGWAELGWDLTEGREHFRTFVTDDALFERAAAAPTHPLAGFDAVMAINLDADPQRWARLVPRVEALGVGWRLERVAAVPTPDNHHVGCALSWRAAIAEAKRRGLSRVLVLEDDVLFASDTLDVLRPAMAELYQG
ncbi:glycosyltransferase [Propioniciclava tarda]|uniref:Glycosyltransferase n=1 Tax=Propioniciclava tarda TaxID=433330 RepID=A0A4Q9KNE6_PROTD|nr:glycosyltransferase [Propioniciclava tarda]TBT96117.1 glycosyltransferase [Propioniciclava tarda]SMO31890.1 Glycosyl transferase family 2 [Propioniciclava tarda]